jgi:transposase
MREQISELVRELSISAHYCINGEKKYEEFGQKLDKVDLKQMPEQERISELERKLKGSELECVIL